MTANASRRSCLRVTGILILLWHVGLASAQAQVPGIECVWHEVQADGVVIRFEVAKDGATQGQLFLQRLNHYNDTVGQSIARPLKLQTGAINEVKLNPDDLRGAAYLRYVLSVATTPTGGVVSTIPQRIDLSQWERADQERKTAQERLLASEKAFGDQKKRYEDMLAGKEKDITALQDRLASLDAKLVTRFLPDSITLAKDPEVSPGRVGFYITTNRPGPIEVIAKQDRDGGAEIRSATSPIPLTSHTVLIETLAPGETYRFEVRVLNFDGTELPNGRTLTYRQDSRLRQRVPPMSPAASVTIRKIDTSHDKLTAELAVDKKALVAVELLERIDGDFTRIERQGVAFKRSPFGRPENSDSEFAGADQPYRFEFRGLKAETEYRLEVISLDQDGQEYRKRTTDKISTKQRPPDFDFNGSLDLQIGLTGFSATWYATDVPTAGSFDVVFQKGGPITSQAASVNGKQLTATLDTEALKRFYDKAKEKRQPKQEDQPTLVFKMTNGSVNRQASIKLAYTMPTAQQVEDAKAKGVLSEEDKKKILSVVKSATDEGAKIKWQDVLSTGLGIVLRFL